MSFTGTVVTPEIEPTKTGYTFNGWYLDIEGYTSTLYVTDQLISLDYLINQVCSTKPFSYIQDTEDLTLWFLPRFEINTYTLTISMGYYSSSSGRTVALTASGCSITNKTLTSSNYSSKVSHAYSTTPISVNFTCNDVWLTIHVDGNTVYNGKNSGSYTWTPNANHSVEWYLLELHDVVAVAEEGIATAKFSGSGMQNVTSTTDFHQDSAADFVATLKKGYVFDGWYNGTTRVSTNLSYSYRSVSSNLTLTAKAKRIYDMIEYNSADQYFYFKDGLYPQSYAGWDLTDALNTKYNNKTLTAEYSLSIAGQECPVVLYNNYYYARVWSATEKNLQITPNANPIYFGTYYFWYKLEPIVWRVSDYGVSIDYYADVLYDRFEADGGVIYGVSDLVVDFGQVDSATNKETGWKYGSSEMYRNNSSNYASLSAEFSSSAVGTWSFDQISDESTNSKIVSYDRNVLGFVQASVKDIDRLFQSDNYATVTNGKNYNVHNTTLQTSVRTAKASDLVCVLMGIDYDDNASYTTRDLFDNSNSFRILTHGAKNNRFFDNACGVRLAYAVNGKSGTTNTVTLATGSTFNETLKRAFDSSVIGVNYEDQTVGSITFGKLNAQGKYYNANNVEITSSNPYIDVSSALNVSIKAYITEGAGGLKDIYVLSDKYILANAESDALFHWFSKLKFVRFDNFFTTNATDLSFFFNGCSELVEVDVSNFDTAKVTSMENMFAGIDVEELDVSSFITANVTNMSSMFSACDNLKKLDLSNFETSNVTDMNMMFWNCEALTSLNLSNFDTKNVLDMSDMFFACWELTELDLSSFKTTKVQNMDGMFRFSVNLKTIYVGTNWSTTAVTSSTDMFSYCSDIVGGNGTTYNESYVDKTYARVDASGTPGYFTFKS